MLDRSSYNNLSKVIFRPHLFVVMSGLINVFFCNKEAKDQTWSALIKLLKSEVVTELDSAA